MNPFVIAENRWFAWQMIPGYIGERTVPYCSPIYVKRFRPLKSGKGIARMIFHNALYAKGVQDFELELRVLKRADNYLIGEIQNEPHDDRCAIISRIEFQWVARFCPELYKNFPPTSMNCCGSISGYLDNVFFDRSRE